MRNQFVYIAKRVFSWIRMNLVLSSQKEMDHSYVDNYVDDNVWNIMFQVQQSWKNEKNKYERATTIDPIFEQTRPIIGSVVAKPDFEGRVPLAPHSLFFAFRIYIRSYSTDFRLPTASSHFLLSVFAQGLISGLDLEFTRFISVSSFFSSAANWSCR